MIDLTPLEIGQRMHSSILKSNDETLGDEQAALYLMFNELGWFDDSWVDSFMEFQTDWWDYWGEGYLEPVIGTWDESNLKDISDLRMLELEDYRGSFNTREQDLGKSGFAQASNIGIAGDLGGEANWRDSFQEGVDTIETDFTRGREDLWSKYGSSFLDMFQALTLEDAFGPEMPEDGWP